MNKPNWGLLPDDVIALLKRREWDNRRALKSRLKDTQLFPIEIGLKPPTGNAALENIPHFQTFVAAWKSFDAQWEKRRYRNLLEQDVPTKLIIKDITTLAQFLGTDAVNQLSNWQARIDFILSSLSAKKSVLDALIDHIEILGTYQQPDLERLINLIQQLKPGLGNGNYLRALPLVNVNTKFIETNFTLIEAITDAIHDGTVKSIGLTAWLGCKEKPKNWLLVRPLCDKTKSALGGLPLLRLSTDTLLDHELPASHILVVENEQSCLALPVVHNTIAVAGGGKDVSWMAARWLSAKCVAYWGDIDSEGFQILSDVRSKLSDVTPLMMDAPTVTAFANQMVSEPDSVAHEPPALLDEERILFSALRSGKYHNTRLEQERIPQNYVQQAIDVWTDFGRIS